MVFQMFLICVGFGLAVAGGVSMIAYLNLLTTGLTFIDYLFFVSTRVECYLLVIGVMIITAAIYFPRRKNNHTM